MMVSVYIIGSAFTILMLAGKLREARRQLRQMAWERDAVLAAAQVPVSSPGCASIPEANVRVLPPAGTDGYPGRRPGQ